jgi:hypothetical protein
MAPWHLQSRMDSRTRDTKMYTTWEIGFGGARSQVSSAMRISSSQPDLDQVPNCFTRDDLTALAKEERTKTLRVRLQGCDLALMGEIAKDLAGDLIDKPGVPREADLCSSPDSSLPIGSGNLRRGITNAGTAQRQTQRTTEI